MRIQSLEDLENSLRNDAGIRVCLILGPELYQCQLALDLVKRTVLSPDALAFDFSEFCAGDASADQIIGVANTFPMMSKKRLVLVTEANNLPDSDQDVLLDALAGISPRSMQGRCVVIAILSYSLQLVSVADLGHLSSLTKPLTLQSFILDVKSYFPVDLHDLRT